MLPKQRRPAGLLCAVLLSLSAVEVRAAEHPDAVRVLLDRGEYVEAEAMARRILTEVDAAGAEAALTARVLDLLVEALWRTAKSCEPETTAHAERAIQIREQVNPRDESRLAKSLKLLGRILNSCGRYGEARSVFDRALIMSEQSLGPDDPRTAGIVKELAFLDLATGRYKEAATRFRRALAILSESRVGDELEIASILNGLAAVLYYTGDYAGARARWEQALVIRERILGHDHVLIAGMLNNLGALLTEMGDYSESKSMLERALDIRIRKLPPGHEQVGTTTHGLAALHHRVADYDAAERLYERSLDIHAKIDKRHPSIPMIYHNLGDLHFERGGYEEARSFYKKARAIWEEELGPEHPNVGDALFGLAKSHYQVAAFDVARPLLDRAVEIRQGASDGTHPKNAEALDLSARLLAASDRWAEAFDSALKAESIGRQHQELVTRVLAEREALRYADVRPRGLDLAMSIAVQGGTKPIDSSTRRLWDALIRSRALVLEEMVARQRGAIGMTEPAIAGLTTRHIDAGKRLANLMLRGSGDDDPESYRNMLRDARREKEAAERALASQSLEFRAEVARSNLGFEEVEASLPSKSALVAFAAYEEFKKPESDETAGRASKSQLLALVLRSGQAEPAVIPLGSTNDIDALILRWNEEITRPALTSSTTATSSDGSYRAPGTALRERVWDPLEVMVGEARYVLVVPEGALHKVSFSSLPRAGGGFLVDSGRRFHYLTAERDLVPMTDGGRRGEGLLALGSPDFDEVPATAPAARNASQRSADVPTSRGDERACAEITARRFNPLPETKLEVEEVARIWKQTYEGKRNGSISLLIGAAATEASFKSQASGKRVIHLATHGFFLEGACRSERPELRGIGGLTSGQQPDSPSTKAYVESLLLSGLALAGANRVGSRPAHEEDGILTAEEIGTLNLQGIELAVLSACDTGLGKIETGEGVLGMRRAFQVAGVQSLITSLWAVSDDTTREWMREFYAAHLERGMGVADAVHQANVNVLKLRRDRRESTQPFYWAAFVAAGRWQ